ncbi:MAG: hypothetical protein ACLU0O_06145 [Collinsella sp.]
MGNASPCHGGTSNNVSTLLNHKTVSFPPATIIWVALPTMRTRALIRMENDRLADAEGTMSRS